MRFLVSWSGRVNILYGKLWNEVDPSRWTGQINCDCKKSASDIYLRILFSNIELSPFEKRM